MRHAVINLTTGIVENVAEIVDGDGSTPETGFIFVASETAGAGDTWDGTQIVAAPSPPDVKPRPVMTPADQRKAAYQSESDALVIRAVRLQLAGDPAADAAKDEALAKVAEIKARLPDLEAK
jgi:hypothetical protein